MAVRLVPVGNGGRKVYFFALAFTKHMCYIYTEQAFRIIVRRIGPMEMSRVYEGEENVSVLAPGAVQGSSPMGLMEKLGILTDSAKYDVACTSSGVERKGNGRDLGNCVKAGICHSFSSDGRCISLLKILMTNEW